MPLEIKQKAGKDSYNYFRHFVGSYNKDVSLSLTVFSGSPVLYATFNPAHKWPQTGTPDVYTTRHQATMITAAKGKALFIPAKFMQQSNSACQGALVDSTEACVLFASVLCESAEKDDYCKYSVKLTYESSAPQAVIVGQPQHNVVKDGSFNYYYMTVKESTLQQGQNIMAVLSSMKGNADLYIGFKDTPQGSNPDTWEVPNQNDYVYKSTQVGL